MKESLDGLDVMDPNSIFFTDRCVKYDNVQKIYKSARQGLSQWKGSQI